ncbi:hypothetical protein OAG1_10960 [Agarivorans sp. OAG1]|uniref:hypothetical protein n=1 Tax=Agarivorans sp. OAG1 TaxID=3082387 RepID=UPI002B284BBE|nr:hypothetical protein OAG1_10960 [Agarivorans sp. OAG1]
MPNNIADQEGVEGNSEGNALVDKLLIYKELVSIIIFFAGGVVWIYAAFATQDTVDAIQQDNQKSLATIECLIGAAIAGRGLDQTIEQLKHRQMMLTLQRAELLESRESGGVTVVTQVHELELELAEAKRDMGLAIDERAKQDTIMKNKECSQ